MRSPARAARRRVGEPRRPTVARGRHGRQRRGLARHRGRPRDGASSRRALPSDLARRHFRLGARRHHRGRQRRRRRITRLRRQVAPQERNRDAQDDARTGDLRARAKSRWSPERERRRRGARHVGDGRRRVSHRAREARSRSRAARGRRCGRDHLRLSATRVDGAACGSSWRSGLRRRARGSSWKYFGDEKISASQRLQYAA